MKKFTAIIAAAVAANMLSCGVSAYSDPYPLPDITDMSAQVAFINTAISQTGYTEDSEGKTVYSEWAGQSGRPWCSEFVSWCAYRAGIPEDIIPKKASSQGFRKFFGKETGRYYLPLNGRDHVSCGCADYACGSLSADMLRPGDILLIETDGNFAGGSDHSCICLYVSGDTVTTIDGNSSHKVKTVERRFDSIHGICRPDFDKADNPLCYEQPELSVSMYRKNTAIKVSWSGSDSAEGYEIYMSGSYNGRYRKIKTAYSEQRGLSVSNLKKGAGYYFKVRAFVTVDGRRIYSDYSNTAWVET